MQTIYICNLENIVISHKYKLCVIVFIDEIVGWRVEVVLMLLCKIIIIIIIIS
jgi:hypothetical protein